MRFRPSLNFLGIAVLLGLATGSLQAQCLNSFPSEFIPFEQIQYTSDANVAGDRLVVGKMTIPAFQRLQEIPLPNTPNQKLCNQVELAPGFFADAYVPTAAERVGDFSSFGSQLFDPLNCLPFSGNMIPLSRIPDPFAWRIAPPGGSAPFLGIKMSKVCYLSGDTVTVSSYRLVNPGAATVAVELKAWLGIPGVDPISIDNRGADGLLQLPPGFDLESGPFDLFSVTPGLARGTYEFSSRLLDPTTGTQLSVRRNLFVIP